MIDVVNEIKAAEAKAAELGRQAAAEAKDTLARARAEGDAAVESAKEAARVEAAELVAGAEAEAAGKLESDDAKALAESRAMAEAAEAKLPLAAKLIAERIVG